MGVEMHTVERCGREEGGNPTRLKTTNTEDHNKVLGICRAFGIGLGGPNKGKTKRQMENKRTANSKK
jgi:hypothetical protein